ncbi:substrate-binding domain-containing protein [Microvirga makkahensis]|uniref:Solute-binding protein n=1 Tax=Microvirga makkahensis TaxID=1128670 RepID=A0A7X3MVZ8_9HYPH|nr:substrate-binding domain-containing protein [Microvirga makkahensis]MXQ14242.1 solute-binding protein [Microvirga makkahensis]
MTDRINGVSSMATRQILADLAGSYEERTGIPVAISSMGGVEAARRIRAGEVTDVVVLASNVMEQLESEGHVVPGSRAAFARSGIAVAAPSGAPRAGIDDEEAVRSLILSAGKVCYSTGPSGDHLMRLLNRWGVAGSVSQRLLQAPPGVPVGIMIARGEADLGLQQMSELLHIPGIEILGPLPPEIQAVTVFAAGISGTSSRPEEAWALIDFLNSAEAEAAKCRHGMEPA